MSFERNGWHDQYADDGSYELPMSGGRRAIVRPRQNTYDDPGYDDADQGDCYDDDRVDERWHPSENDYGHDRYRARDVDIVNAKAKPRQLNGRAMKAARWVVPFALSASLTSGFGYGAWHTGLNALPLHSDSKGFNKDIGHDVKTFLDGNKIVLSGMKNIAGKL